jgi:hypothetical protein
LSFAASLLALLGLLGAGAALASPAASAAISISSNWAGYAAVPPAHSSSRFRKVSGTWTEPAATCTAGRETYSAAWVGLGGFNSSSKALEQIGTDADCARTGTAVYYAWFELVPAAPVDLKLQIHAGDHMSASVAVSDHRVTLRIHDLSTGVTYLTTRHMASPDVTSADWIVEAPSVCVNENDCQTLPLSDFTTLRFTTASATIGSHSSALDGPDWVLTELALEQGTGERRGPEALAHLQHATASITATPSAVENAGGAFSVVWQEQQPASGEQSGQGEQTSPSEPPGGQREATAGDARAAADVARASAELHA